MKNNKPTLIFVSNPFGYGPTGTLIPVIKEFEEKTQLPLVFVGSGLCLEIFSEDKYPWKRLEIITANEREFDTLASSFLKFNTPYVISSLNRFAIQAANTMKITKALMDPLGWFWKKRPEGYSLADIYFYNNFGYKIEANNPLSNEIPLIVTGRTTGLNNDSIVFHIGGAKNPFVNKLQTNYLKLLLILVGKLEKNIQKKIIIDGGKEAIDYLLKENNIYKYGCSFKSLSYYEFEEILSSSSQIITPAGMGVTFSSFYLQKPTIIYLPENLSQVELSKIIKYKNITPYILEWQNYLDIFDTEKCSEENSILEIDKYASTIINDDNLFAKLARDFTNLVDQVTEKKITPDISSLKFHGEQFIFEKLSNIWHLNY